MSESIKDNKRPQATKADWTALIGDVPEAHQPYIRISNALTDILSRVPRLDAEAELLNQIASDLEAIAATAAQYPQRSIYANIQKIFDKTASTPDLFEAFDFDALAGVANAVAPKLNYRIEGDTVIAEGQLGLQYQGPPGRVHGGFIAGIFDVVLARAQHMSGRLGLTGQLSIKYLDSTPVNEQIRFVGRVERTEGKKVFVSGACFYGDKKTAEASGIWICPDFMNPV